MYAADLNTLNTNILNNALALISPLTGNLDCGGFRLTGIAAAATEASPSIQPTGDTNTGIRFSAADTMDFVTAGADRWQITSAGHLVAVDTGSYDIGVSGATQPRDFYNTRHTYLGTAGAGIAFINDSANANMTIGLTINQGGADNEILAFKSSDVTNGFTALAEADTYSFFRKYSATDGGLRIAGLSSGWRSIVLTAYGDAADADDTDTSTSIAVTVIENAEDDGANGPQRVVAGNIFAVTNYDLTRLILKQDGEMHITNTTLAALDEHDDVALVRALTYESCDPDTVIKSEWDEFVRCNKEDLVKAKVLSADGPDGSTGLMSLQQLQKLHNGAIWQLHTRQKEMEKKLLGRIAELETKLREN